MANSHEHIDTAQQEPVAVVEELPIGEGNPPFKFAELRDVPTGAKLYTTPQPPAQPLTDEQKWRMYEAGPDMPTTMAAVYMRGIADAEAAHGITGEKK